MPHCRCIKCGSRRTLAMDPADYLRGAPPCLRGSCKSRRYRVDSYRTTRERGKGGPRPCKCQEYHYPHRRGSGWCIHNLRVTSDMREEQWCSGGRQGL